MEKVKIKPIDTVGFISGYEKTSWGYCYWIQDKEGNIIWNDDYPRWHESYIEKIVVCPSCNGDGKETCHNPDHGAIRGGLLGGEMNRLGCPCCGHDENYKIPNGGDCELCSGIGECSEPEALKFIHEMNYEWKLDPIIYSPMQKQKDSPTVNRVRNFYDEHLNKSKMKSKREQLNEQFDKDFKEILEKVFTINSKSDDFYEIVKRSKKIGGIKELLIDTSADYYDVHDLFEKIKETAFKEYRDEYREYRLDQFLNSLDENENTLYSISDIVVCRIPNTGEIINCKIIYISNSGKEAKYNLSRIDKGKEGVVNFNDSIWWPESKISKISK